MRTILIAVCFLITSTSPLLAASGWLTDYEAAVAESKKTGKPIIANFTGSDWCRWCVKLHKEVFVKPEFKTWASTNAVLLELDFPRRKALSAELKAQNQELKKKYGVRGFPTVLILDAEGNKLAKTGYRRGGPEEWVSHAELLLASDNSATDPQAANKPAQRKIEGKMISRTDEEIIIETEDGKRIRIPTKYLKKQEPQAPAAPTPEPAPAPAAVPAPTPEPAPAPPAE